MAVLLKHTTQATGTDAGTGEIRKAQWNEGHTLTVGTGKLLGRTTALDGAVEEITPGAGLTFASGSIAVDFTGYLTSASAASTYAPISTTVTLAGVQTLTNKTITTVAGFETRIAVAASDINLALGNYFTRTISGATTFTVSNVPASGVASSLILDLTNGGVGAITWWAGMKWAGGASPALTAAGRDVLGFFTHDGGTTWSGLVLAKDVK